MRWIFSLILACSVTCWGAGPETELRGRLVCLAEEMQKVHQAAVPTEHEHLPGFKTNDGKFYTLLRTKKSEALFLDTRLKERELILLGRVFPNTMLFESFNMRSVKNGAVYEIFYYCDICAIEAVTPEECQCCRQPVVFTERLLQERGKPRQKAE
jgi:hypothetical protein